MSGSKTFRAGAFAALLAVLACSDDLRLAVYGLEVGPSPAGPGDQVVASFSLLLAPVQQHTIIVTIDGKEQQRVTEPGVPPPRYLLPLGDAADLIAAYGTGTHSARVEVRAEEANAIARTQSYSFQLQDSVP